MRRRNIFLLVFMLLLCFTVTSIGQAGPPQKDGNNAAPQLQIISQVPPDYPVFANMARIEGNVVLELIIETDGSVKSIKAVSGHPLLIGAAIDAVKRWRYKPFLVDGKAVEVSTQVTIRFTLDGMPGVSQAVTEESAPRLETNDSRTIDPKEIAAVANERLSSQQVAAILEHQSEARDKVETNLSSQLSAELPKLPQGLHLRSIFAFIELASCPDCDPYTPRPESVNPARDLLKRISELKKTIGKNLVPRNSSEASSVIALFEDCSGYVREFSTTPHASPYFVGWNTSFQGAWKDAVQSADAGGLVCYRVHDDLSRQESYIQVADQIEALIRKTEKSLDNGDYAGASNSFHNLADKTFVQGISDEGFWTSLSAEAFGTLVPALHEYLDQTAILRQDIDSYVEATYLHALSGGSIPEQVHHAVRERELVQASASKPLTKSFLEAAVVSDTVKLKALLDGLPTFKLSKEKYEIPGGFAVTTPTNAQSKVSLLKEKVDDLDSKLVGVQGTKDIVTQPELMAAISQLVGEEAAASLKLKGDEILEAERLRSELASNLTGVQARLQQYDAEQRERMRQERLEVIEQALARVPAHWPKSECARAANAFFNNINEIGGVPIEAVPANLLESVQMHLEECASAYVWSYQERDQLAGSLPFDQATTKEQEFLSQFLNIKLVNFIRAHGLIQQFALEVGHNTIVLQDTSTYLARHGLMQKFRQDDESQYEQYRHSDLDGTSLHVRALLVGAVD